MQAIIFMGLQGGDKITFYAQRFFKTHLRISLDMLKTRNKERLFLHTCRATGQKFVVDNTNPTIADRKRYIEAAREARFEVVGCFFQRYCLGCPGTAQPAGRKRSCTRFFYLGYA